MAEPHSCVKWSGPRSEGGHRLSTRDCIRKRTAGAEVERGTVNGAIQDIGIRKYWQCCFLFSPLTSSCLSTSRAPAFNIDFLIPAFCQTLRFLHLSITSMPQSHPFISFVFQTPCKHCTTYPFGVAAASDPLAEAVAIRSVRLPSPWLHSLPAVAQPHYGGGAPGHLTRRAGMKYSRKEQREKSRSGSLRPRRSTE